MIKANEIRLGNYLYDSLEDCGYIKVLEIRQMNRTGDNMSVCYRGINGGYCTTSLEESTTDNEPDEYYIQPIPLTEEILLKCGFKIELDHVEMRKDIYLELSESMVLEAYVNLDMAFTYEVGLSDQGGNELIHTDFKYLHQLQNLYFALTNEELKIEL